ncbi:MAG: orotidine-5'-phosphate decarboxylase [SAR324 cluster bacterium]|nr:orotidine-5'-phosphate decarboxylase [SAR324 cluster bacterium]
MIIDQLIEAINKKASPIVAGLDPLVAKLPKYLVDAAERDRGKGTAATASAMLQFNTQILEAIAPIVPAVKLQKACYEVLGPEGLITFEKSAQKAKDLGLIVIDDSKRGDIGSTAALYAEATIGKGLASDFTTVNPYLGWDGIEPFMVTAQKNNKGFFLLVRTSNPSASNYQEASIDGIPLYRKIAQDLERRASASVNKAGYSDLGAVVGATWPDEAEQLREDMPSCYFLVPGYGAQGGSGLDVMPTFDKNGYGALINSSRGIIFASQRDDLPSQLKGEELFADAAAWAATAMKEDLLSCLKEVNKLPDNW